MLDDSRRKHHITNMPDVIEPPAINPRYAGLRPFNSQTASQAARRRYELERKRAEEAKLLPALPQCDDRQDQRLALLAEQIELTRETLNQDDLLPHHRAALLRALCDLLDQQRIARGEPLPGSRKPPAEPRAPRGAPSAEPWEPSAPAVQPSPAPAKPVGWEYDDPNALIVSSGTP